MTIPDFDHNNVLPPYIGNPTRSNNVSPFCCSSLEFCKRFNTSSTRIKLLKHYLQFRAKLNEFQISGFQWIFGSFTENVETSRNKDPEDIDVVTFYDVDVNNFEIIKNNFPEFIYRNQAKNKYKIDSLLVNLNYPPKDIVSHTAFWMNFFSHTRHNVWKGGLLIELNTPSIDKQAVELLEGGSK